MIHIEIIEEAGNNIREWMNEWLKQLLGVQCIYTDNDILRHEYIYIYIYIVVLKLLYNGERVFNVDYEYVRIEIRRCVGK